MSYIKINSWGTVVESEGVTELGVIDLSEPNYSFYLAWVLGTPEVSTWGQTVVARALPRSRTTVR